MAPKKKGGKKAQDDWESELGETAPDPIAAATQAAKDDEAATGGQDGAPDGEGAGAGGLLAALKKNKTKKAKKGKVVEDFIEGEDPPAADGEANALEESLANKAPEEATFEDEDVFAGAGKKGKGGKGGKQQPQKVEDDNATQNGEDDAEEGGKMKSKKEKEKEKKEREKQRKKEQACLTKPNCIDWMFDC
jgi:translation initiation factor 5B